MGALLAGQLEDARQALDAYREVLASEYDVEAAAAVRKLGDENEDLRLEAAEVLEPVLRKAEKWADLVDALELRLRAQTGALRPREDAPHDRGDGRVPPRRRRQARSTRSSARLLEEPQEVKLHEDAERLSERLGAAGLVAIRGRAGGAGGETCSTRR